MALIMMRTQFNEAGFKGTASDPTNRREAGAAGFKRMGWELKEMYYLPATAQWVMICEGDPKKMVAACERPCFKRRMHLSIKGSAEIKTQVGIARKQ